MDYIMDIIFFFVTFVVVFIVDFFFILFPKIRKKSKSKDIKPQKIEKKKKEILEFNYLSGKFKLNRKKLMKKSIMVWVAITNAFIISLVSTVITMIPVKFIFQILIGMVLLFLLIYALYEVFGRILVKKGYND
jgi:hypothetical protein